MSDQEAGTAESAIRASIFERTLEQAVTAAVLQAAGPTRRQLLDRPGSGDAQRADRERCSR